MSLKSLALKYLPAILLTAAAMAIATEGSGPREPRMAAAAVATEGSGPRKPRMAAAAVATEGSGPREPRMAVAAVAQEKTREPLTFEEKKRVAEDMKKIAKQLDVKCEYCHTDAERGLKEGDFTLLTKEGEYSHEVMFPISKTFKVECKFCHDGSEELTQAGTRARKDMKFMRRYKREHGKSLTCKSCHTPGEPGREFATLTKMAEKLMR